MMRSLFSGVAGLKNHQTRMDVIGNNIANVNTAGYKAGRTTFQDMLSQTVQGASAPAGVVGGINPMQIGLGMGVASVDNIFTNGSLQTTGKNTDLALGGDGFFILKKGEEEYYTRAGNFDFDQVGDYVVPGTGLKVAGWNANANGVIDTTGPLQTLNIPIGMMMPAKPSTTLTVQKNLSADAPTISTPGYTPGTGPYPTTIPSDGSVKTVDIDLYDSLGESHNATVTFIKTANNTWDTWITIPDADPPNNVPIFSGEVVFDTSGKLDVASTSISALTFNFTGVGAAPMTLTLDIGQTTPPDPGKDAITQYGGDTDIVATKTDGYPAGNLDRTRISIGSTGIITGYFDNNQSMDLGQVALATFSNPGGLLKVGATLFSVSGNSGVPQIGTPGTGGRSTVTASTLEMSNVDVSEEFTSMITTQRGFQANSRIITTSDSMLEELVNLKR